MDRYALNIKEIFDFIRTDNGLVTYKEKKYYE